jgi:hypothetical protein
VIASVGHLACFGTWYSELPLYVGPFVLIVIGLSIQSWHERRASPDREAPVRGDWTRRRPAGG